MKVWDIIKSSSTESKRNLVLLLLSYFCVLFNYPLVRAASTTLFFEAFGAKSTPTAWLWGVIFLSVTIFLSNELQARFSVQRVFLFISTLSILIFCTGTLGYLWGSKVFTYLPFIWKEIYIVLQVHLLLGYANNFFKGQDFKVLIGVVGGVGSIGGIIGGWLTSYAASKFGTYPVMWLGLVFVLLPAIIFLKTQILFKSIEDKAKTPLSSFTPELKKYVAIIAAIVALSQFIINIADFNFHLAFEKNILDSSSRTAQLGHVYMLMNAVTFILQFLVLPFIMLRISEKSYHLFIPSSYFLLLVLLLTFSTSGLIPLAIFFIYLKASDYSLFSAGKEILYQPLSLNQKYGAKYLTDMLVYRLSKALIAAVLIYLQTSYILNIMMMTFLLLWLGLIVKLFKQHRLIFN
jgi:AAA family ATP:ADP antiporter